MKPSTGTVTVQILDKEYQVACPPEEQEALMRAARELDSRMRLIRSNGGVIGVERIAIMAALNLSHDLLQCQQESQTIPDLERLHQMIDDALSKHS